MKLARNFYKGIESAENDGFKKATDLNAKGHNIKFLNEEEFPNIR